MEDGLGISICLCMGTGFYGVFVGFVWRGRGVLCGYLRDRGFEFFFV